MITKTLLATGLLGLSLATTIPASAKTSTVGYADLDLASKEGQAKLDKRLRSAARQVCDVNSPQLQHTDLASANRCYVEAYARAKQARKGVVQTALAVAR